jgi:hypothetical protein
MIALMERRENVLFLDEAMYTTNQSLPSHVWWPQGSQPGVAVNKLSFPAIAIIAAINMDGEIVAMKLKQKSFLKEDIKAFLD